MAAALNCNGFARPARDFMKPAGKEAGNLAAIYCHFLTTIAPDEELPKKDKARKFLLYQDFQAFAEGWVRGLEPPTFRSTV